MKQLIVSQDMMLGGPDNKFQRYDFYTRHTKYMLEHSLLNCLKVDTLGLQKSHVLIGSSNDLVPSNNKVLHEPIMTYNNVTSPRWVEWSHRLKFNYLYSALHANWYNNPFPFNNWLHVFTQRIVVAVFLFGHCLTLTQYWMFPSVRVKRAVLSCMCFCSIHITTYNHISFYQSAKHRQV